MTNSVSIKIASCRECPHHTEKRHYTAYSWEFVTVVTCGISNKIVTYCDIGDPPPTIPSWCPLR